MGVENYAYVDDNKSGSWERNLSTYDSFSVDSEFTLKQVGGMHESSADGICLSFPSKPFNAASENSYNILAEKGNQYEDLVVTQANYKSKFENVSRPLSTKKGNKLYEPTINEPKTKYRTKNIKGFSAGVEDNSKRIYLVFSFLVAMIAITAAAMVFMILFGVISVKKCKECELFAQPKSDKQTQVLPYENINVQLQLASINVSLDLFQTLQLNATKAISALQSELETHKKKVFTLTAQLEEQKKIPDLFSKYTQNLSDLVGEFIMKSQNLNKSLANKTSELSLKIDQMKHTKELEHDKMRNNTLTALQSLRVFINKSSELIFEQMNLTREDLKESSKALFDNVSRSISTIIYDVERLKVELAQTNRTISNLTLSKGIQGLQGFNGSQGPQGKSANFSSCKYAVRTIKTKISDFPRNIDVDLEDSELDGNVVVGAFCTSTPSSETKYTVSNKPTCTCKFVGSSCTPPCDVTCYLHCWFCPG